MTAMLGTMAFAEDSIHVAIVGPLTGNNAFAGEALFDGAKLRFDEFNEAGGLDGVQIVYDEYDTKADANEGVMIAQKLAADDTILATIGPWSSTVALAMDPIIDEAQIIMYSTSPSHVDVTKNSQWAIRQSPISEVLAKASAIGMYEAGYTKGVYLYDNSNEGATNGSGFFEKYFTEAGGTVIVEGYTPGTKDFTPLMTKYKQEDPDFIAMYGATADSALICLQARDMDIDCLLNVNPMAINDEFCSLIEGLEDVYQCDSYAADYPSEELQAFVSAYQEKYGEIPILHAYLAYMATDRLIEGIEEVGYEDRVALRDWLRNGIQKTPLGDLTFVEGDADRDTIWSKFNGTDAFEAITELPPLE